MKRFKRVGIILDLKQSNELVLEHAGELVRTNQAKIYCLCVLPEAISEGERAQIESQLSSQISFEFEFVFLLGVPIVEITRFSVHSNFDIILTEPDVVHGISRFFYGPLSLSLMRKTPCPIWVVKRPVSKTYARILIAVDPELDDKGQLLNDKLIQIGTSYAKLQGAECHLVTAWRLIGEETLAGPFISTPAEKIETLKTERKIECAKAFEVLQKRHESILQGSHSVMLNGDPGVVIPEYVSDKGIDLVVMGTVARSGVEGFLIGNTAETVISQLECSIMAVKPDEFKSPIRT